METVNLNFKWDGDPFFPEVTVDEINDNDVWDKFDWDKAIETSRQEVLNKVAQYKLIVINISNDLKINSDDIHRYIMGWL